MCSPWWTPVALVFARYVQPQRASAIILRAPYSGGKPACARALLMPAERLHSKLPQRTGAAFWSCKFPAFSTHRLALHVSAPSLSFSTLPLLFHYLIIIIIISGFSRIEHIVRMKPLWLGGGLNLCCHLRLQGCWLASSEQIQSNQA